LAKDRSTRWWPRTWIACENLPELAANTNPERWLLRVQRNRFIDRARRRQRAPVVALNGPVRTERLASTEAGPEELLLREDEERALDLAFQQLDDTHRLLLSLRAEGYVLSSLEDPSLADAQRLEALLYHLRSSGSDMPLENLLDKKGIRHCWPARRQCKMMSSSRGPHMSVRGRRGQRRCGHCQYSPQA
jgi:hypothetical protein